MNFRVLFRLVEPRSKPEDLKRREFILNVLLLGSIILSVVTFCVAKINLIRLGTAYKGVSPAILLIISLLFLALYFFSRAGFFISVAYIFIGLGFASATYTVYTWGVDIPQGLLVYALIIVMSGVLISTKFAFVVTLITTIGLILLAYFQINMIIHPYLYWRNEMIGMEDIATIGFTLGLTMLVSWLSNREIEKALKRARRSETALKKERDLLEIKVIERTKELEKAQLEKTRHLYRLADFGRMAAGLFHDFVNPLTLVSLNLEQLQARNTGAKARNLADANSFLERAVDGTRSMENFAQAIRRQLQKQKTEVVFCLNEEISQAINVFAYKAKDKKVRIRFINKERVRTYGNPFRFNQLVSNLVSNSIDAYDKVRRRKNREIIIKLARQDSKVLLTVQDFGCGIQKKNLGKIFNLFFTTKSAEKGVGIGLPICKDIVEKELGGKIEVESKEDEWTTATVDFPIRQHGH